MSQKSNSKIKYSPLDNFFVYSRITLLASLTIIPIILSIGIIPSISFVDALQDKDSETQCREGQVLVFRTIANNFVCVSEATAERWVELGIAEIVSDVAEEESIEESMEELMEELMEEENVVYDDCSVLLVLVAEII